MNANQRLETGANGAALSRVFDDFYVGCAVCSGSRTALLTGTHYQRLSMRAVLFPNSTEGLHPDEVTIADLLKTVGYKTACVGKWHLGHLPPCLGAGIELVSWRGAPKVRRQRSEPSPAPRWGFFLCGVI
jgi:arylsulfatase A